MPVQPSGHLWRVTLTNLLTFLVGAGAVLGLVLLSASLDGTTARDRIAEAYASGALDVAGYREIEVVPGFLVMESDNFSTCVMLSQMLAPSETVFADGVWAADGPGSCLSVQQAVSGSETRTASWYRYWHGASAWTKIALSFTSVQALQIILLILNAVLVVAIIANSYRRSRSFGVGLAFVLLMTSDLLWHGLSLVHGWSSLVGLIGLLLTQVSFARSWPARWAIVLLAGFAYAVTAQMLIPMAFAILTGIMAMAPLLNGRRMALGPWLGIVTTTIWVAGYVVGLASRYAWVEFQGPGIEVIQGELQATGSGYATSSPSQPFLALVGLLTKTWLGVGWMQIGLMLAFGSLGWILARGGSQSLIRRDTLISALPIAAGLLWLLVWAGHTNHTFVNVLLAAMLAAVLFSVSYSRSLTEHRSPSDDAVSAHA